MSELEIVRLEFAVWHGEQSVVWQVQVTVDREQEEQTRTVWEREGAEEFIGETHCSPGYTIGFLEQEPKLDPAKTVIEVVREATAASGQAIDAELVAAFAELVADLMERGVWLGAARETEA